MSKPTAINTVPIDWTFQAGHQFKHVSNRCADAISFLRNDLKLQQGDRIGICHNANEDVIAIIQAAFRLGVCLVFFNNRLNNGTLLDHINNSELKYCFSESIAASGKVLPLPAFKSLDLIPTIDGEMPDPESPAFVIGSSGSSGEQKWIRLSQRAILHAAEQANSRLSLSADDTWLLCLPLFHIGGLSIVIRCALSGAHCVLCPEFKAPEISQCIKHGNITGMSLVPTMLHRLLAIQDEQWHPQLRCILLGGAKPNPNDLIRSKEKGCIPIRSYGLTEFASHIASQTAETTDHQNCGRLLPGIETQIDAEGRLLLRGPQAFSGYEQDGALIKAHSPTDWFGTEDLARIEDDQLFIIGRMDDVIIRGGENISLSLIQSLIENLQLCEDCLVVPIDDLEWGQVPALAYQGAINKQELQARLRSNLAGIHLPSLLHRYEQMPLLGNGKHDRQQVLQDLQSAYSAKT